MERYVTKFFRFPEGTAIEVKDPQKKCQGHECDRPASWSFECSTGDGSYCEKCLLSLAIIAHVEKAKSLESDLDLFRPKKIGWVEHYGVESCVITEPSERDRPREDTGWWPRHYTITIKVSSTIQTPNRPSDRDEDLAKAFKNVYSACREKARQHADKAKKKLDGGI